MVALFPSNIVPGEFIAEPEDARAVLLLAAVGATSRGNKHHLTPARARKYAVLVEGGWEAVGRSTGFWFTRNGCKPMRLSDAMRAVAALGTGK